MIQACWGGVVGLRPFAQLYCLDHSRVIIRKGLDWTEPGPLGAHLAREWDPLPLLFRSSCCRLLSAQLANERVPAICHHLECLREREGDVGDGGGVCLQGRVAGERARVLPGSVCVGGGGVD